MSDVNVISSEPRRFYLGVTRERIRQIEAKAHDKIRQHDNIARLKNY